MLLSKTIGSLAGDDARMKNHIRILFKNKVVYETVSRYVLGLIMLSYGLIKILRIQFILPPSIYEEPLKNLDGVTLTWAFLGYSAGFSVFLGFVEAIPATLLLFQRTKLLGTLLILPVLINVFFINIAFDFLLNMKLLSGGLLLMNIIILFFHYPLLKEFYKKIINLSDNGGKLELIINSLLIGGIVALIIGTCLSR